MNGESGTQMLPKALRTFLRVAVCRGLKRAYLLLFYRDIAGYLDIDGWLTFGEARALYELARCLPDESPVAVEIGSWLGRSSLVLAKGMRLKSNPVLHCVDPFNADGGQAGKAWYSSHDPRGGSLKAEFIANMEKHGVWDSIDLMEGYSFHFAEKFSAEVDLLFIDGNHDYDAVVRDFSGWSKHLKRGGLIAFHDVGMHPGVTRAVEEHVLKHGQYEEIKRVDSLFVAAKRF